MADADGSPSVATGLQTRLDNATVQVLHAASKLADHTAGLIGQQPEAAAPNTSVTPPVEKPTSVTAHLHLLEEAIARLWQHLERL